MKAKALVLISMLSFILTAWADSSKMPWDVGKLRLIPETFDGSAYSTNGVNAVFIEGEPYQGQPTRIFAYYGIPASADVTRKVPGIILVHGAGGSAFHRWVKLWVDRGYAAMAIDTCGAISGNGNRNHPRHEFAGPPGWGGFDQMDQPVTDQWVYHAVSAIVRSHSLLASWKEVDTENIGITGISWGGFLTCIAASIDDRFQFAIPVYGCGFIGENSSSIGWDRFEKMGSEKSARWKSLWDPSVYLPLARVPFLWVTGAKDTAFPMDSLQKSYNLVKSPVTLCIKPNMSHGQLSGETPAEIHQFAEHHVREALPMPQR